MVRIWSCQPHSLSWGKLWQVLPCMMGWCKRHMSRPSHIVLRRCNCFFSVRSSAATIPWRLLVVELRCRV
ncbi:hypothetical protein VFPPC_01070 [Pochonia chlamydosporia 170]|uniref:Uncharacterized protein n=1 Tax=Pochonia chlamydosporia 170 TaxID=1380566 RepID=A0A179G7C9_METCM|nr:hypothetical protein VFPPC_01070 [Pochonia chlamydosporia 170]OAQ73341.1 hypothetical protein VFPPC_01070 [Pochonia chlamydosporia 170]